MRFGVNEPVVHPCNLPWGQITLVMLLRMVIQQTRRLKVHLEGIWLIEDDCGVRSIVHVAHHRYFFCGLHRMRLDRKPGVVRVWHLPVLRFEFLVWHFPPRYDWDPPKLLAPRRRLEHGLNAASWATVEAFRFVNGNLGRYGFA